MTDGSCSNGGQCACKSDTATMEKQCSGKCAEGGCGNGGQCACEKEEATVEMSGCCGGGCCKA